jgi:hypothetical protein
MYPVSERFRIAIRKSHPIVTRATILTPEEEVTLSVLDQGFVNVDEEHDTRRRCSLRLFDHDGKITPRAAGDLFHLESGHEINLERGVRYADGTEEFVPLGTFGFYMVEVGDGGEGVVINVEGKDRSGVLLDKQFREIYYIPHDTNYGEAIHDLLDFFYPGLSYSFTPTDHLTARHVFNVGDNPWKHAVEMAKNIGMRLYFDQQGVCVMEKVIDPLTKGDSATYADGEQSVLLYVNNRFSREDFANHIIVIGDPPCRTCIPVVGEAENQASIDRIGRFTYVHRTTGIHYEAQAIDMAQAELIRRQRGSEETRIITVPNPAHDVGDVMTVSRPDAGVQKRLVASKLTIPMEAAQPLNITMRSQGAAA